jgi:hypothetical protein
LKFVGTGPATASVMSGIVICVDQVGYVLIWEWIERLDAGAPGSGVVTLPWR